MANSIKAVEPLVDKIEEHLKAYNSTPSVIYSANHVKLYEVHPIYEEPVNLSTLPKHVTRAVLAAEDKRFYQHSGVDPWALLRVGRNVFTKSENTGGGSTITMQLAKKLFSASEKTMGRKVQDIAIAIQLEKRYTKDQILELYVNQIYYGEQAYGLNAAAEIYFGKKAEDLDLAEAAMIARCIRTPSKENPIKNYQLADANKIVVLNTMREENWITEAEYEKAKEEKPKARGIAHQKFSKNYMAPYFVAAVKRDLERQGINISEGGYTITTTLDTDLQKDAEESVRSEVHNNRSEGVNVAAFICMDNQGRILADVGGRDFSKNQFSYTTQSMLQPGSSFKSFVYAEALKENVVSEGSEISNEMYVWHPHTKDEYKPRNHGGYGGTVSLERAFALSINVPAVRTFMEIGAEPAITHIKEDFGFKSELLGVPSAALGSNVVKMSEMLEAYSVFMSDGKRVTPYRIKEIVDPTGALVFQGKMDFVSTRIGPDVCGAMDKLMLDVVSWGTGTPAGICPDAHGKTGTTNEGKSGWFCGYAKGVVGIAWAGRETYNKKRKMWLLQPLPETYGASVAAPIWGNVMISATKKYGSDIRPDLTKTPEEGRHKKSVPVPPDANNDEPPVQDDSNITPTAADKPTTAPGTDEQGPPKNSDGSTDPQRDSASDTSTKPDNTEIKKPKDDKSKKPARASDNEMVEVEVCADSGNLATRYCPETINKRVPKSKRPKKRCSLHKAPDEGGGG